MSYAYDLNGHKKSAPAKKLGINLIGGQKTSA